MTAFEDGWAEADADIEAGELADAEEMAWWRGYLFRAFDETYGDGGLHAPPA